jgi:hypothetical protein
MSQYASTCALHVCVCVCVCVCTRARTRVRLENRAHVSLTVANQAIAQLLYILKLRATISAVGWPNTLTDTV